MASKDVQNLAFDLVWTLQSLRASRLLHSSGREKNLLSDLIRLSSLVQSDDFDLDHIRPLLEAALADDLDDALVWSRVYDAVAESTPPPQPLASSVQQTPWLRNTNSFANSSEYRKYVDAVLREELGLLSVGHPDFHETYFGDVPGLEAASEAFIENCSRGSEPLFDNGWRGWPGDAKQDDVLSWFVDFTDRLTAFAKRYESAPAYRRGVMAKPYEPIDGSIEIRKMDIGFVNDPPVKKNTRWDWTQILVPGQLKSNPSADTSYETWLDLGRSARKVFAAQGCRRFVLGFTLCGSLMRMWAFDRLGAIASEQFNINKDGLRFVSAILGFLWMSEQQLGFDPTIMTENGQQFIEIEREGATERLILDGLMRSARCIAGRATTCWKAYREHDPHNPLVVKDSWQFPERDEEGELLREATSKGAVNVVRYYHHETVRVRNADDDVRNNVRKGLDVTKATNIKWQNRLRRSQSKNMAGLSRTTRHSNIAGAKRSSDQIGAPLPPNKRLCSTSSTRDGDDAPLNRVHRRVVLCDYGVPIDKASSLQVLVAALADCIEGHKSLREKAGLLHRDISIGNLMVSRDNHGFLIDLDLAINEQRLGASGAKGKTGTRAFMAIGALLGEKHSFMHDLESLFWVLFWICIHSDGTGRGRVVDDFDRWNFANPTELAKQKLGTVCEEDIFCLTMEEHFTEYCRPLAPWVNKLRKAVFPGGGKWKKENSELYTQMKEILEEARKELAGV